MPGPTLKFVPAVQKAPSHMTFATPGFGKKKPEPLGITSNSPVIVSSTENTPSAPLEKRSVLPASVPATPIAQAIAVLPSKRSSPLTFHAADPPTKRVRSEIRNDKENVFDTFEGNGTDASLIEEKSNEDLNLESDKEDDTMRTSSRPPPSPRRIDFYQFTPSKPQRPPLNRAGTLGSAAQLTSSCYKSHKCSSYTRAICLGIVSDPGLGCNSGRQRGEVQCCTIFPIRLF